MIHGRSGYSRGCRCDACRDGHRVYMREYLRVRGGGFYAERICPRCGLRFANKTGKAVFCSRECQNFRPKMSDLRRRARATVRKAERGSSSRAIWVQGTCDECGEYFVRHGVASAFCSTSCSSAARRRRRRALKHGMKVTPARKFRIHERDNWTCHICGDPVNRDAKVPELDAPTLDHVIALAAGGAHDESNLKTAHFYCNSVKRDLPLSEVA